MSGMGVHEAAGSNPSVKDDKIGRDDKRDGGDRRGMGVKNGTGEKIGIGEKNGRSLRAFPLPIPEEKSAACRRSRKPVLQSVAIDRMEDESVWELVEQGTMSFTDERARPGCRSVRLESPTTSDKSYQTEAPGRPHGKASVLRRFPGEDWSGYNRIRFWVYPTLPGFRVVSMSVVLHNEGEERIPDAYLREGIHYFLLKPDRWNEVVWEIAHLPRDRVTGLEFVYRLQGSDDGATRHVRYDISGLELQIVEPDYAEGWPVAPGSVAYCHSGYEPGAAKTALVGSQVPDRFRIVKEEGGETVPVLEKPVERRETALGSFGVLIFSELREPGSYRIEIGDTRTEPFPIGERVWESSLWKTLNFFYCLRCGTEVPGIHGVCHRDFLCEHDGKRIVINGGWHDAGDLSQGLINTAEAVHAMLDLADALPASDGALAERLREEARWGLEWVLKTRFGDGYRTTWATMDLWTDGILGTADDEVCEAGNDPHSNFTAAIAEAAASRIFRSSDPILADRCLTAAREDWAFALKAFGDGGEESEWTAPVIVASAGISASVELYRATGEAEFLNRAAELAGFVLDCQERRMPEWDIPLRGFYYASPERRRLLHFPHRGHEQAPTVALIGLMEAYPEHPGWGSWYAAVVLHSEYMKSIAAYAEPYGMLSAGVYDLEESESPEYRDQALQGVRLSERHYLRRFPVWYAMRGNTGTGLSQAKAVSAAARLRRDESLRALARLQLEWTVGRNPFAQSLMYGEGHNFSPQYSATSGDICGSLPVGIQTRKQYDVPYWPVQNCYNATEVWVHPSSRWLSLMADLYAPEAAGTEGRKTGKTGEAETDANGSNVKAAPASPDIAIEATISGAELEAEIRVVGSREGLTSCRVYLYNLDAPSLPAAEAELKASGTTALAAKIRDPGEPVVIVVVPDGRLDRAREWVGLLN
ncbi:endoglucanase [Cohnella xylanilytica]|uniref:glycoside hydrolase family 9 protein n=1 Tax=Cohnella xylanilytica TaxID=557555 RepID=UPI001B0BA264|nr:glycoside hydrolase family 9 protein [Cohnella xylanilytica]GIO16741.1 endoglucanase [Cohnella xylanilytica]